MFLLFLKVIGLLVITAGGVLALANQSAGFHSLNTKILYSIILLGIGFLITVIIEIITFYKSRSSERWKTIKVLPLREVLYSFRTLKPTTAKNLISKLNKIELFYCKNPKHHSVERIMTLKWHFNPNQNDVEKASKVQLVAENQSIVSHKVNLSLITIKEEGPSYISRQWSQSINDDWAADMWKNNVGGIEARISWGDHRLGSNIIEVSHLIRLGHFGIRIPEENYLNQFADANISFFTHGGGYFSLDLKSLHYYDFTGSEWLNSGRYSGWEASLDGVELMKMWKNY